MENTEPDKFKFCGELCAAARRLGIGIREEDGSQSGYAISFHDPAGSIIYGEAGADRKEAMYNACLALCNYLNRRDGVPVAK